MLLDNDGPGFRRKNILVVFERVKKLHDASIAKVCEYGLGVSDIHSRAPEMFISS